MVFVKRPNETTAHVVMKSMLWGLYLPTYPDLAVEIALADRYQPDLVSFGEDRRPRFWGEAGQVTAAKIRSLAKRYRGTHFAIAKWAIRLAPHVAIVKKALAGIERSVPFDLLILPDDAVERFIDEHGTIRLTHDDLEWVRLEP